MHILILGFDSFDPDTFELLSSQGKLPNLTKYAEQGGYTRLKVSDPPQTEVSWTSLATGLDPGGHGIFDFVHRDPKTYVPYPSLLPTRRTLGGVQFVAPYTARTIFDEAVHQGYPATTLWWPATFPAKFDAAVNTIPGLGTPDIHGRLGVGTCFTTNAALADEEKKTAIRILYQKGQGQYTANLEGPASRKNNTKKTSLAPFHLTVNDDQSADLILNQQKIHLPLGKWSPIFDVTFKVERFFTLRALTRAILTKVQPHVQLYFLPLQIHPLTPLWRYAAPPSFSKTLWKHCGPYLTLGWPQDTTALEEGFINDNQFLELCFSIHDTRLRILESLMRSFREGILAAVFDCLDRVQHMFKRGRQDIVEDWYKRLDNLVGQITHSIETANKQPIKLFILSDHGFTDFRYKVHLNRWLVEKGYLVTKTEQNEGNLEKVDWSHSQAYAVGLNSLYLNLANRESQGIITAEQAPGLLSALKEQLESWKGPDGRPVVQRVLLGQEAFTGPLVERGPDLVIGYSPGYRASAETGLGKWKEIAIEENHDHWGADHCVDSQCVPGVLFSNSSLQGLSTPSFRDIPELILGKTLDQTHHEPPHSPSPPEEERGALEERLKSLGYL